MSQAEILNRFQLESFDGWSMKVIIQTELALRQALPTCFDQTIIVAEEQFDDPFQRASWEPFDPRYQAPLLGLGRSMVFSGMRRGRHFEELAAEVLGHERGHAVLDELIAAGRFGEIADQLALVLPGRLTGEQLVAAFGMPESQSSLVASGIELDPYDVRLAHNHVQEELGNPARKSFHEIVAYGVENALRGERNDWPITHTVERFLTQSRGMVREPLVGRLADAVEQQSKLDPLRLV